MRPVKWLFVAMISAVVYLLVTTVCLLASDKAKADQIAALEARVAQQHVQMLRLTAPEVIQDRTLNMLLGKPYEPGRYIADE